MTLCGISPEQESAGWQGDWMGTLVCQHLAGTSAAMKFVHCHVLGTLQILCMAIYRKVSGLHHAA